MVIKWILIFLFCLVVTQTCLSQSSEFYDKVLDNYGRNSFFVVIDVVSSNYTGKVIVENGYLYNFLNETRGFDKKKYKDFMKDLWLKKGKLQLKNSSLDRQGIFLNIKGFGKQEFIRVERSNKVEDLAAKGRKLFVENYFDSEYLWLKPQIGIKERSAVINKLFDWQIATYIEDVGGFLILVK